MHRTRRRSLLAVATAMVGLLAALTFTSAASAAITHPLLGSLTECKGNALKSPWGVTFDATGNLLLAEPDAEGVSQVVDIFSSANVCTGSIGAGDFPEEYTRSVAVSNATGDVYVGESGPEDVFVYKPEGAGKYKLIQKVHLEFFLYVAVDNSKGPNKGDLYVISGSEQVDVFTPGVEGKLGAGNAEETIASPTRLTPPPGGFQLTSEENSQAGITVSGTNGELYVAEPPHHAVSEYGPEGTFQKKLEGKETPAKSFEPIGVAVDQGTNELFVLDGAHNVIDQFSSEGKYVAQITGLTLPQGLAVENYGKVGLGKIYVTDGAQVKMYAPWRNPGQFGRCVAQAGGKYATSACDSVKAGATKFEWLPGPGPKNKFTSTSTTANKLETANKTKVSCTGETSTGEVASASLVKNVVLKFTGCNKAGPACTTPGHAAGEIVTAPLEGGLGVEKVESAEFKDKIAEELHAPGAGNVAEFECSAVKMTVRGSFFHPVKSAKMLSSVVEKFTAAKGHQKPEVLANGEKQNLEFSAGGPFEPVGLTLATTTTFEENIEINPIL